MMMIAIASSKAEEAFGSRLDSLLIAVMVVVVVVVSSTLLAVLQLLSRQDQGGDEVTERPDRTYFQCLQGRNE